MLNGLTWTHDAPSAWLVAWTLVLAVCLYLAWKLYIYPDYVSPLRKIDGPDYESFFCGNELELFNNDSGACQREWADKYGKVFCYRNWGGDKIVLFSDPKAIHYMLVQQTNRFPKPPDEARGLSRILGDNGLITVEGDVHRRQRKIVGSAFTQVQISACAPIFQEQANKLADRMDQAVSASIEKTNDGYIMLNICPWLSKATLEIISLAGFDYPLGCLDTEEHDLNRLFNTMLHPHVLTATELTLRYLLNIHPILAKLPVPLLKPLRDSMAAMHKVARDMLGGKLEMVNNGELDDSKDLLSLIIKANKLATSERDKMSDAEVLGQVTTFLLAGHETSSEWCTALTWIFHMLSQRPEVQDKLRNEVKGVYADAAIRGESHPSFDEISDLPYLDAVVRETLRYIPPVYFTTRENMQDEIVPLSEPIQMRDGTMISEVFLPKNSTIGIDISLVNRDKETFGEDADEYRPERWLEDHGALGKKHRPFTAWSPIFTILGGPRSCIGFRLAISEIKVILSTLIHRFEVQASGLPIGKRSNIVARPIVEGRIEEGAQLPIKIRLVKAE